MGQKIAIEFARLEDRAAIQSFIDAHWRRDHILARSAELLDWQHRTEDPRRYDYVVARQADGEFAAMLGFIRNSRYDPALAGRDAVWLALWIVRPDLRNTLLGVQLLNFLKNSHAHQVFGTVGCNSSVVPLYQRLGFATGTMRRFFTLNPCCANFALLSGSPVPMPPPAHPAPDLRRFVPDSGALFPGAPSKTQAYFQHKYAEHPFYRYDLWSIERDGRRDGVLAGRFIEQGGSRCLRLVDFAGNPQAVPGLSAAIQSVLIEEQAEWADLLIGGDIGAEWDQSGFALYQAGKDFDLPTRFEPYEPQHHDLLYAVKGPPGILLFKADSDQDRPNQRALAP